MGDPDSFVTEVILADRTLAGMLQGGAYGMELLAFVAIFQRHVRLALCVFLVGFHLAVYLSFGIPFFSNIVMLVLVFLPWYEHQEWLVARWAKVRGDADAGRVSRSSSLH